MFKLFNPTLNNKNKTANLISSSQRYKANANLLALSTTNEFTNTTVSSFKPQNIIVVNNSMNENVNSHSNLNKIYNAYNTFVPRQKYEISTSNKANSNTNIETTLSNTKSEFTNENLNEFVRTSLRSKTRKSAITRSVKINKDIEVKINPDTNLKVKSEHDHTKLNIKKIDTIEALKNKKRLEIFHKKNGKILTFNNIINLL